MMMGKYEDDTAVSVNTLRTSVDFGASHFVVEKYLCANWTAGSNFAIEV